MKKTIVTLFLILCILIMAVPASAVETLSDLKKIHNNLTQYLYTPFFENSEYYEAYKAELDAVGELIEQDTITQNDIDTYYARIRSAYSHMMRDIFDYSSLNLLLEDFEILNEERFTPESWKKIQSVVDNVKNELEAPTLFQKSKNMTFEDYKAITVKHIATFTSDFYYAYNALELIPAEGGTTKDRLSFYLDYCGASVREDLMGKSAYWKPYLDAVKEANACLNAGNPRQTRLDAAESSLISAYEKLCENTLDYTPVKEQQQHFSSLNSSEYSRASWKRYKEAVENMNLAADRIPFVYLPSELDSEQSKLHIQYYFDHIALEAKTAFENLVSQEMYETLSDLCQDNQNPVASEGLEIKANRLITRVHEGIAVLNNEEAIPKDFKTAIKNLETAKNDLDLSEAFLEKEKNSVVKQDTETIQLIVIFSTLSIALSLVFALIVSKRACGKINWKK